MAESIEQLYPRGTLISYVGDHYRFLKNGKNLVLVQKEGASIKAKIPIDLFKKRAKVVEGSSNAAAGN